MIDTRHNVAVKKILKLALCSYICQKGLSQQESLTNVIRIKKTSQWQTIMYFGGTIVR